METSEDQDSDQKRDQYKQRRSDFASLINKLPFTIGPFKFLHVIGQGAFSTVFQIVHTGSNLTFAAKCIRTQDKGGSKNIVRSEINALKTLYHPNIVKIYDVLEEENFIYIILEHCGSTTMKDKIANGPIPYKQLIHFMYQCLKAVSCCHAHGVAHRDIKPANIFVKSDGRIILGDFGLSKISYQQSSEFCGSLPFLPPEMIKHKVHDPMKADIWSLGVTFYAMAYGVLPWSLSTSSSMEIFKDKIANCQCTFMRTINGTVIEIIQSMMKIDPNERPTADELLRNPIFTQNSKIPIVQPRSQFYTKSSLSKISQFTKVSHSSLKPRTRRSFSYTFA